MSTTANSPPTNVPAEKPRRRFRLQISLRMLLLVMLLAGVGLTIFRWPWVETTQMDSVLINDEEDFADYQVRTTYHRSWDGKPILHGISQLYRNEILVGESKFYDGSSHGQFRKFDHEGRWTTEVHYRDGQLHGPFRLGDGQPVAGHDFFWVGNYARNEPHGEWRVITERTAVSLPPPPTIFQLQGAGDLPHESQMRRSRRANEEYVVRIQNWQRGKREGAWQTQSLTGEVLSTAEYRNNELYLWNGQPVVGQFWKWLDRSTLSKETKQFLVASRTALILQTLSSAGELRFEGQYRSLGDLPLVIYVEGLRHSNFRLPAERLWLVPALCELACENGYAFDCRFGTLWLVPHADPAPAFVDPTGVTQIQFAAESPQASDWLAEIPVFEDPNFATVIVQKLLAGSSITKEESLFVLQARTSRNPPAELFRLPRRDAIGLVLFRSGYHCRQRGNELYLRYPADQPNGAMFQRPLQSPYPQ